MSLNLDRPNDTPVSAVQPTAQFKTDPAFLRAAAPVITERANAMFDAGIRPESFYLAIEEERQGAVCFLSHKLGPAVMVFTSGFQAADYLRETKISGGIHEFPASSFRTYAQDWKRDGAGAFALDRCPRCPAWLPVPIKDDLTDEQINRLWTIHRATRIFQAQRCLRFYIDTSTENNLPDHVENRRRKREALEVIRDHIDCSVPYLHWMIAMEANMSHDDEVRLAALDRLSAFGPNFRNKAVSSSEGEAWTEAVAECHVGLLGSFQMLKLPRSESTSMGANEDSRPAS